MLHPLSLRLNLIALTFRWYGLLYIKNRTNTSHGVGMLPAMSIVDHTQSKLRFLNNHMTKNTDICLGIPDMANID